MRKPILLAFCFAALVGCSGGGKHGIDVANMDRSADPAQDFYRFANGGWLQRTEIPESESRWGIGSELRERNREALHELLTGIAGAQQEADTNAQKVGDFYFTGMDTAHIEALGASPLQPYFDEIAGIRTFDDVLEAVATQQKIGGSALFNVGVEGDLKQSDISAAYAFQGGLGMPDRQRLL